MKFGGRAMKVGIVGCGSIGRRHMRNALALGHTVTIHDVAWKAILRDAAFDAATVVLTMASLSGADAVLICTPADTHTGALRHLRDAGYAGPLFVEKPICTDLADAPEWRAWPHRTTMVGYNWRWHRQLQDLVWKSRVAAPDATLHFVCDTDMTAWPGQNYGAPLLECSHEVDQALALGASLAAAGSLAGGGTWLQFQRPNVVVDVRWFRAAARRQLRVSWRPPGEMAMRYETYDLDLGAGLDASYRAELAHFLAAAAAGTPTVAPFATGLGVVDVCEQAQKA